MNESRDVVRLYSQHVKIHAVVLSDDDNNSQTWFEQNKEAGFRLTMESLPHVSIFPDSGLVNFF